MARPRKEINWDEIEKLCFLQCTQEEIAWFCGVSLDTIERRCRETEEMSFAEFYEQKRGAGRIRLRRAQFQAAEKGNPALLIWLGKQHLDQKDKATHELSGPGGKPINHMTDEQLEAQIAAHLAKVKKE